MPPVTRLPPEAGVPHEDLLLDGAQHDEDETKCGKPREYTEPYAQSTRQFCSAEKAGKPRAHPNALTSGNRILQVTPAAPDEDPADEKPHEEQREIAGLLTVHG